MKKLLITAIIATTPMLVPNFAAADEPRLKGFGLRTAFEASSRRVEARPNVVRQGNGDFLVNGYGKRTARTARDGR